MPYWAAAGAALGGLLGGAAQGGISYASAQQQQAATREAYQHRYQWTMEDMKKAGLNPLLAASHGAGSVGSMAQMETPNIASAVQAASQVRMQDATADQSKTQSAINIHTAREAAAKADVAEKTLRAMDQQPDLYRVRAGTEAGLNASSAIGAAQQAVHAAPDVIRKGVALPKKAYELYKSKREHSPDRVIPKKRGEIRFQDPTTGKWY